MDHISKLKSQIRNYILLICFLISIVAIGVYGSIGHFTNAPVILSLCISVLVSFVLYISASSFIASKVLEPLSIVLQAMLYVTPENNDTAAPNLKQASIGKELITSMVSQVYQMASKSNDMVQAAHREHAIQAATVVSHMPLPLFVFNNQQLVTNASDSGLAYCEIESSELFGKPLYENVLLEFPSEHTLETWVKDCEKNKVTDTSYWERVRVRLKKNDSVVKQCDIAAYYNRDNPSGTEFIVTMFDRTDRYDQDDASLGFIALAVHELRTPLTTLRGYIEVFEDELAPNLDDELKDFMHKMRLSANQLSTFVNNILNVAKIEGNQLELHLTSADWNNVLTMAVEDMELKARINDKIIEVKIEPNLPPVAVDKVSIIEVITNLIDNAIKYSETSKRIIITAGLTKDGMVETTVQDFGVGIDQSVIPNLFEKFYRNHRTRSQIGGTGLGLYLSKAIVDAHGGQIWVKSKEGEGSIFGFSIKPYSKLAEEEKKDDNGDITRSAHGWIKNHSLYRR